MGIYNSAVITNTGQALLAQSVAGNDLKFTTVKTSNYTYPSGTSLADLTTLTGIKQSKNITGATVYNSRVIKVSAMVDNAGVTAEYSINTIGVYATIGTAAEQLFAVITAQEADKMPAFNSRPYSYIYDLNMTMQGAANITVTVNNAGFVNINDLNNALDGVNESITDLDETVNDRIDTLSSSVDTRINALNDALETIGVISPGSAKTVNVANSTFVTVDTMTIANEGTYVITGDVDFGTNSTGLRILILDTTATNTNNVNNSATVVGRATIGKTRIVSLTANTTLYLRAYQTSGSTLSCTGFIRAIKLWSKK